MENENVLHEQRPRTWNMIFQPEIIPKYSLSFQILEFFGHIINNMNLPEYNKKENVLTKRITLKIKDNVSSCISLISEFN